MSLTVGGACAAALPAAALRAWRSPLGSFVTCRNHGVWFAGGDHAGLLGGAGDAVGSRGPPWALPVQPVHLCMRALLGARRRPRRHSGPLDTPTPTTSHDPCTLQSSPAGSAKPEGRRRGEQPPCPHLPSQTRQARRRGLLPRNTLSAQPDAPTPPRNKLSADSNAPKRAPNAHFAFGSRCVRYHGSVSRTATRCGVTSGAPNASANLPCPTTSGRSHW